MPVKPFTTALLAVGLTLATLLAPRVAEATCTSTVTMAQAVSTDPPAELGANVGVLYQGSGGTTTGVPANAGTIAISVDTPCTTPSQTGGVLVQAPRAVAGVPFPVSGGFETSPLSAGSHTVYVCFTSTQAAYCSSVDASPLSFTVPATTVTLSSSLNPSTVSNSPTFTLTVTGTSAGGQASGAVTFTDTSTNPSTQLGTVNVTGNAVNNNASASLPSPTLTAGTHTIVASYAGSSFYAAASATLSQVVTNASSTTTLASSANPSVYGQSVTLTATVSTSGGTPTGSVTFYDGPAALGSGAVGTNGLATYSTSTLSTGSHSITATYGGDSNFPSSTTATAVTQQVNQASTTTAVASSSNPSTVDASVTFTAAVSAVSPGAGAPTGTVTFYEDGAALGTPQAVTSGSATYTTTTLSLGTHSITAVYDGDANFSASPASLALSQGVQQSGTTVAVSSSENPSTFGASVTLTAVVTSSVAAAGNPTGTVTFTDGTTALGTGTLALVLGQNEATFTTSTLAGGSHSISVSYQGDTDHTSASGSLTQTVNVGASTTGVASATNPSVYGQSVTFTATVSGTGGTPSGGVTFLDGTTQLGTGTLSLAGQASYSSSLLAVGSHAITASYGGDTNFAASAATPLTDTVNQASSSIALSSSSNPTAIGSSVTFTATVAAVSPGAGSPTGTVTFYDGTTNLGNGSVSSGSATFAISTLALGSHSITATYNGDTNFSASPTSGTVSQVIQQSGTTITVGTSQNPLVYGASVTFAATATATGSSSGTPTGTIKFFEGTTSLGSSALNMNGMATFTPPTLSGGIHTVTAKYAGDTNHTAGTGSISEVVLDATPVSTVQSTANPSVHGQSVAFTATVTGPGVAPTGTITFFDGMTVLGKGTLNAAGTATFSTAALSLGAHAISVSYGGDSDYTASTASLSQTVNQAATTTKLASSSNPAIVNASVTLTAVVAATAPGAGAPTGTVTFNDGVAVLGVATVNTSGGATFSTSALAVATHEITAVYSGDVNFASSTSTTVAQVIAQNGVSTSLASSLNPSTFGAKVTFTATVMSTSGGVPTGTIAFTDGAAMLGAATLTAGVATLSLSTLGGGSHAVTATYGGDGTHAGGSVATVTQIVNVAGGTTTLASSANPAVSGQSLVLTATVAAGATGSVTFFDGTTSLGTGTVGAMGIATLTTSLAAVGSHPLSAVYAGDPNFEASTSTSLSQVVNKAATSTQVASSNNPAALGATVTFTATVAATAPGAGVPTGTVTLMDGTSILSSSLLGAGGVATFGTSTLSGGTHSLTAVYAGSGNFTPSTSSALAQLVSSSAIASIALTAAPSPSTYGAPVTLTAVVGGTSATPTGTVTFSDGTTTIGSGTLDATGTATLTTSTLAALTHMLVAAYSGDGTYPAGTGAATEIVATAATTTTLASSVNPSSVGESVAFTATLTSAATGFTGTVQFMDGATSLGTVTLTGTTATFTTTTLALGAHAIVASYSGDANFAASASSSVAETVNATIIAEGDGGVVDHVDAGSKDAGHDATAVRDAGTGGPHGVDASLESDASAGGGSPSFSAGCSAAAGSNAGDASGAGLFGLFGLAFVARARRRRSA